MKCLFLMMAALLVMPVAAAAQDTQGKVGVGLSFLNEDETTFTGFTVDYSKPIRTTANNLTIGWVGDFSFHRHDEEDDDDFGFDASVSLLTFQGGVRVGGQVGQNPNLTWHAQGLLGALRFSTSVEDLDDECDLADEVCGTKFIFSPGGGIDYSLTERTAVRAQIDFPLGDEVSSVRFWFGISYKVGQ
jgi:hypothetical protein